MRHSKANESSAINHNHINQNKNLKSSQIFRSSKIGTTLSPRISLDPKLILKGANSPGLSLKIHEVPNATLRENDEKKSKGKLSVPVQKLDLGLNELSLKKSKRLSKNISEKNELERLLKEREVLRKQISVVIDKKAYEIMSRKMFILSNKINYLIKKDDEDSDESNSLENKNIAVGEQTIKNFSQKVSSKNLLKQNTNMPEKVSDFFVKNNKISQIFKEIELLEQGKKINVRKKYYMLVKHPNFYFIRDNDEKLYRPSSSTKSTLNLKSYRPKGFRSTDFTYNDGIKSNQISRPVTAVPESVFSESEHSKSTIKLGEKRKSKSMTFINSKPFFSKSKISNVGSNNPGEVDKFRNLIMEIHDENKKNSEYMKQTFYKSKKNDKFSKKNIMNNIDWEKKNFKKIYEEKIGKKYDPDEEDKESEDSNDEENQKKFLKKLDKRVRKYYANFYRNIAFEKRILNKDEGNKISSYEQQLNKLKLQKEFKAIAYETMALEGKDNNMNVSYMKNELMKDFYSLGNLEWQVKKHSILKKIKRGTTSSIYK